MPSRMPSDSGSAALQKSSRTGRFAHCGLLGSAFSRAAFWALWGPVSRSGISLRDRSGTLRRASGSGLGATTASLPGVP